MCAIADYPRGRGAFSAPDASMRRYFTPDFPSLARTERVDLGATGSEEARSHLLFEEVGVGDGLRCDPLRGVTEAPEDLVVDVEGRGNQAEGHEDHALLDECGRHPLLQDRGPGVAEADQHVVVGLEG